MVTYLHFHISLTSSSWLMAPLMRLTWYIVAINVTSLL